MSLIPNATDPNRKAELERIHKMAKEANGKEKVKQEFGIDLEKEGSKLPDVKNTVVDGTETKPANKPKAKPAG